MRGYLKALGTAVCLVVIPLYGGIISYNLTSSKSVFADLFLFNYTLDRNTAAYEVVTMLPDFLWSFGLTSYVSLIYGLRTHRLVDAFLISCIVSTTFEILQYKGYFKGTYDTFDILLYVLGAIAACILIKKLNLEKISFL
jgi:glycopeptide antibiotics resistance protein